MRWTIKPAGWAVAALLAAGCASHAQSGSSAPMARAGSPAPGSPAGPGAALRVGVQLEALWNGSDGSLRRDCGLQETIDAGRTQEAWLTFGVVRAQGEQGWEAVAPSVRCGSGTFDRAIGPPGRAVTSPYLIVDLEVVSGVRPGGQVELGAALTIRRLSSFDNQAQPVYAASERKGRFDLAPGEHAVVPLLLADARERDALDVQELFLRIAARALGQVVASYGAVAVTADMPGVDLLLDGGLVGRTAERGPVVLKNVAVGRHEVRVRDFSGRVASAEVTVQKDAVAEVGLTLLGRTPEGSAASLVPLGKNPQGFEEYWRTRDGAVAVRVPGGPFTMGSAGPESDPSEGPPRQVLVSEFLADKTEVTWRQYMRFAQSRGIPLPPLPPWGAPADYPVSGVTHDEAAAYCQWVGGRLPTEAEWEKAARGTDERVYPWGNVWDVDRCNGEDGGPHRPEAVASFPGCVSFYGLMDMAGSVWEWCADWYADRYAEVSAPDPKGPDRGRLRVLRGGSWLETAPFLRSPHRHKVDPLWRNTRIGFRCVQEAPP
jgi:sulfatase modifying factor 1